jgi:hypothetical protein
MLINPQQTQGAVIPALSCPVDQLATVGSVKDVSVLEPGQIIEDTEKEPALS